MLSFNDFLITGGEETFFIRQKRRQAKLFFLDQINEWNLQQISAITNYKLLFLWSIKPSDVGLGAINPRNKRKWKTAFLLMLLTYGKTARKQIKITSMIMLQPENQSQRLRNVQLVRENAVEMEGKEWRIEGKRLKGCWDLWMRNGWSWRWSEGWKKVEWWKEGKWRKYGLE